MEEGGQFLPHFHMDTLMEEGGQLFATFSHGYPDGKGGSAVCHIFTWIP